jgi:hypothetical protein
MQRTTLESKAPPSTIVGGDGAQAYESLDSWQTYLVEGVRLVGSLLESLKQRKVQALVLPDVLPDSWQQHERQEALRQAGVQIRNK